MLTPVASAVTRAMPTGVDCLNKGLIKEALDDLVESPLDGEDFNLVVDAFACRGLLYINNLCSSTAKV